MRLADGTGHGGEYTHTWPELLVQWEYVIA
jgi:hypothetical protein